MEHIPEAPANDTTLKLLEEARKLFISEQLPPPSREIEIKILSSTVKGNSSPNYENMANHKRNCDIKCDLCTRGVPESVKNKTMTWTQKVKLALWMLTFAPIHKTINKKEFRASEICRFLEQHWDIVGGKEQLSPSWKHTVSITLNSSQNKEWFETNSFSYYSLKSTWDPYSPEEAPSKRRMNDSPSLSHKRMKFDSSGESSDNETLDVTAVAQSNNMSCARCQTKQSPQWFNCKESDRVDILCEICAAKLQSEFSGRRKRSTNQEEKYLLEQFYYNHVRYHGIKTTDPALMSLVNKLGWEVKRVTTWLANRKVKEKKSSEKEIGIPKPILKPPEIQNVKPIIGNTCSYSKEVGEPLDELEEQLIQLNCVLSQASELLKSWKLCQNSQNMENETLKRENATLRQEIAKFTRALKAEDSS